MDYFGLENELSTTAILSEGKSGTKSHTDEETDPPVENEVIRIKEQYKQRKPVTKKSTVLEYALELRKLDDSAFIKSNKELRLNNSQQLHLTGLARYEHIRQEIVQFSTDEEVLRTLKDRIIYEDERIIVFNKPYGLAVHNGPSIRHSIMGVTSRLTTKLYKPDKSRQQLILCHRLDKDTTGVVILAKGGENAHYIREMFIKRDIGKLYWAIVCGIPDLANGIIDMPIAERSTAHGDRLMVKPNILNSEGDVVKRARNAKPAITEYNVKCSSDRCSAIELRPSTGVKHQLRIHLAMGLDCPVLGDHKYSHQHKLAPQQPPPVVCNRLGITRSQARYLPAHLHARSVRLPGYLPTGKDLVIEASPVAYFRSNMRRLRLRF